jgi:putative oxidoreductase
MAKKSAWIVGLGRVLLGLFFVLSGAVKAWDPAAFQQDVLAYQLVEVRSAFVVAHYLPFLEIALGVAVWTGIGYRVSLLVIAVLLFVFIGALSWTWALGLDIRCGCLGPIDWVEDQPAAIARDGVLLGIVIFLGWFDWKSRQLAEAGR